MDKSEVKEGDALFHQGKEALNVPDVPAAKRFFLDAAAVLSRALALRHDTLSHCFSTDVVDSFMMWCTQTHAHD